MTTPKSKWREKYSVHPTADLFPMLSETELGDLGRDIKARGQIEPIVLWCDLATDKVELVDGRNRLEAMERAGITTPPLTRTVTSGDYPNPAALVVSLNIQRRHLTPSERANLAAKALILGDDLSCNVARNPNGGRPQSVAGRVAKLADVSKHTALEQVAVAADAALQIQVDAKQLTPEAAGKMKREKKKGAKKKKKEKEKTVVQTTGGTMTPATTEPATPTATPTEAPIHQQSTTTDPVTRQPESPLDFGDAALDVLVRTIKASWGQCPSARHESWLITLRAVLHELSACDCGCGLRSERMPVH